MKLRFYARGTGQVPDQIAQDQKVRRMVGREWIEVSPGQWAFAPLPIGRPYEIEAYSKLIEACQEGALWAADEATAAACGVKFDPTFGGEAAATTTPAAEPVVEKKGKA